MNNSVSRAHEDIEMRDDDDHKDIEDDIYADECLKKIGGKF